ncbi:CotH kinase family protein [Heyndrickxia acidiproducens]|uniref:CotH kinase family protein n=1 Tax=Heyndrickxia acidiproducens TaxID=1121084 RepID=UPI00037E4FE2|nr:CotH kinase family protein [Heyndrickxia acidiproducens]
MKPMNIPIYQLYIHPQQFRELKKDIWNDEPLPASLIIQKKRYDIDIAYRGSHIRKFPKKSYFISFYAPKMFRGAKAIHLNGEYKDPSLIRNKLSLDFFSDIGVLSPRSRHVFLKVNGKNEGIYLELESVDEQFLQKRELPNGPIYYAVNGDANFSFMSDLDHDVKSSLLSGYERKTGTEEDSHRLETFIYRLNTMLELEFEQEIGHLLNVDRYLRWLAGIIFTQNYDGFVHNYALYENHDTGLFEIIPWDYDATWGRDVNGKRMSEDYVDLYGYNTLTARLLGIGTFRRQYQAILKEILANQFSIDMIKPKVETMYSTLSNCISLDPYKNREKWLGEPALIYQYIEARSAYIRSQLEKLNI